MSKKETIIMAVLINCGLLLVLFMSALKTDVPKVAVVKQEAPRQVAKVIPKKAPKVKPKVKTSIAKKEKKKLPIPKKLEKPIAKAQQKPKLETPTLRTVTVQKGDVLEKIARGHGVKVQDIMKLNGLKNSRLNIGQVLTLPESRKIELPSLALDAKYYVVKAGDNPWTIARKNDIKVEELLDLNRMDEQKATRIQVGDKLRIR